LVIRSARPMALAFCGVAASHGRVPKISSRAWANT
jgi:hypothetical protein